MSNPRASEPTVRRAVISVESTRRRQLLHLLEYIDHRRPSIDEDMYRIDLAQVVSLKELFTTEDPDETISISFTHEDLFALETIVEAADTYGRRDGEHGISGVSRRELEDLRRWVAGSERWFITPLKVEILRVGPEMHRRITEVLWYVENRAWLIDPDMFRIEVERVHELQKLFRAEFDGRGEDDPPAVAVVTFQDVNSLAYFTMAAREYSARRSEKGLLDVSHAQLDEMLTWLAEAEDRLRSNQTSG